MAIPTNKDKLYTYADYKTWPENARYEILDGTLFNMSPAPGTAHQKVSGNFFQSIANYLEDKPCQGFSAPFDVFLPEENDPVENIRTIVQPDLSIICDDSKLSEKGCTDAPDIIIEIISPSTASHDQMGKL